jgi:hypothetical protein
VDAPPRIPAIRPRKRLWVGVALVAALVLAVPAAVRGNDSSSWLNPFPAASIWNRPLSKDPKLDPRSKQRVAFLVRNAVRPNVALHAYATAVALATRDAPDYSVRCTVYRCHVGRVRIPLGTKPDPSEDGHLAVWDPFARREWDFWMARYDEASDTWSAAAGAAMSTDGNGIVPRGRASGNAANFPLLAGMLRPEEIARGRIDHVLMFGMPHVAAGKPRCPATHNAGDSHDPAAMPEGTRLQLDPKLNVDALQAPAWEKTVMRALQRYGMFLRDGSGSLVLYAENVVNRGSDAWADVGLATKTGSVRLTAVPWSRMRVIAPPRYC